MEAALALFAPDAVFVNAATLQALHLDEQQARNARIRWQQDGRLQQLRIAGTVSAAGAPVAVMDIGAMQDLLQQRLWLQEHAQRASVEQLESVRQALDGARARLDLQLQRVEQARGGQ